MLFAYLLAIFLSAALLFLVQPMAAKLVLPVLGGSPSVWNTTMVFFQALLLLGYLYSHVVTRKLPRAVQGLVHAGVIAAGALMLPIALPRSVGTPGPGESPALWLLMLLPLVAGVPFFVLTTTGPLLQSWFASSDHRRAKDPYFLYAASNIGSFVGLLSFPFFLEPRFDLSEQAAWFSRGYYAFAGLAALCFVLAWRGRVQSEASIASPAAPIAWTTRLLWIALAAVPSSLSLGVTQTITTDVAPVPLLWVVPLSIYLLTFVLAFSAWFRISARTIGSLLIACTLGTIGARFLGGELTNEVIFLSHIAVLFSGALMCHRRLAESRPGASGLTEFYLWLAVGGVLGGLFNALLAPLIFNAALEYPFAIAASCALIPSRVTPERRAVLFSVLAALLVASVAVVGVQALGARGVIAPASMPHARAVLIPMACVLLLLGPAGGALRFGVAAMVVFVGTLLLSRQESGELVYVERTFFGIHEVYRKGDLAQLQHGTTIHGMQRRDDRFRRTPLIYFHPDGPLGDAVRRAQERSGASIGVIGLGAGSIAAYSRPGDEMTFFEIDPAVAGIARNPDLFTYLTDAQGKLDVVIGDGRAALSRDTRRFDLIILDAFSSDSVPLHLLTREAVGSYREHLRERGAISFHVSSRFLVLAPIIAATVASTNVVGDPDPMIVLMRDDSLTREESARTGRFPSTWLMAMRRSDAAPILARSEATNDPTRQWREVPVPRMKPWTDAYSSIWSALLPAFAKDAAEAIGARATAESK
ncbi:MAG TPA: fused MFS/spermidine synthase [Phycisphaerales bacterium]